MLTRPSQSARIQPPNSLHRPGLPNQGLHPLLLPPVLSLHSLPEGPHRHLRHNGRHCRHGPQLHHDRRLPVHAHRLFLEQVQREHPQLREGRVEVHQPGRVRLRGKQPADTLGAVADGPAHARAVEAVAPDTEENCRLLHVCSGGFVSSYRTPQNTSCLGLPGPGS